MSLDTGGYTEQLRQFHAGRPVPLRSLADEFNPKRLGQWIYRRLKEWAAAGLSEQVHALALRAYERMIGLDLRPSRSTAASPRRREARWPAARRWIGAKRGEAVGARGYLAFFRVMSSRKRPLPRLRPCGGFRM